MIGYFHAEEVHFDWILSCRAVLIAVLIFILTLNGKYGLVYVVNPLVEGFAGYGFFHVELPCCQYFHW